jgi:hypothetical protein
LTSARTAEEEQVPLKRWQELVLTSGGIITVLFLPTLLLVLVPLEQTNAQLPFMFALGCKLIIGWLVGRSTDFFLGLPPLLGYMVFGYLTCESQGEILMTRSRKFDVSCYVTACESAGTDELSLQGRRQPSRARPEGRCRTCLIR